MKLTLKSTTTNPTAQARKGYAWEVIIRGQIDGRSQEWAAVLDSEIVTVSAALSSLMLRAGIAGMDSVRQIKIVRW